MNIEFVNQIELLITNNSYKIPLLIIKKAAKKNVYMDNVYDVLYEHTQDKEFSNNVYQLIKLFRVSNDLFKEYMLMCIDDFKKREGV